MGEFEGATPPHKNTVPTGTVFNGAICAVPMYFVVAACDNWNYNASNPCLYVGGNYNQNGNHGMFYVNYNTTSNSNPNVGCRNLLMRNANLQITAQVVAHLLVKISEFGERVSTSVTGRWKARTAKRRKHPYEKSKASF